MIEVVRFADLGCPWAYSALPPTPRCAVRRLVGVEHIEQRLSAGGAELGAGCRWDLLASGLGGQGVALGAALVTAW